MSATSASETRSETTTEHTRTEQAGDQHARAIDDPILHALSEPLTLDALMTQTGMDVGALRASLTMLEIQGRVRRDGPRFEKTSK